MSSVKPSTIRAGKSIFVGLLSAFIALRVPSQTLKAAQGTLPEHAATRHVLAVRYVDHKESVVDMVGTANAHKVRGRAEVQFKNGRSQIRLKMGNLGNPQSLGALYTTFILWAIAPEGQADNIAELPAGHGLTITATTPFQTFGLIVTAEPYSAVKLPGPAIVAENVLQKRTEGAIEASRIDYRGNPGTFFGLDGAGKRATKADKRTPLLVLGARRAVEIARRAGAEDSAEPELRSAEIELAALEQNWPSAVKHDDEQKFDQRFGGTAHDVMRQAEHARELAIERADQARLTAERQTAAQTIQQAQHEADRAQAAAVSYRDQLIAAQQATDAAREQVAQAQTEAERARAGEQLSRAEAEQARLKADEAVERVQQEVQTAREQVAEAKTDADRARANENLARADADQARLQAEEVRRERDDIQRQLNVSLSQILETRREARGLIVSLSDVLFDVDRATLKPGAREKLNKLVGILLAYAGPYAIDIEGHTDSIGSDAHNIRLSQERADSVRACLTEAGIPPDHIIASRGLGKSDPVASNETSAGRQLNRRVEIVIHDAPTQTNQR